MLSRLEGLIERGLVTHTFRAVAALERWLFVLSHPAERRQYHQWRLDRTAMPLEVRRPWICYPAAAFLASRVNPGARVFEYGGGGSTVWLEDLGAHVITVEHDMVWYQMLSTAVGPTTTLLLKSRQASGHMVSEEGSGFFDDYVDVIRHEADEGSLDLVIVDGMCRVACVEAAAPFVRPGGLLVLDDSQRRAYRPAFALLDHWPARHFTGLKPGGVEVPRTTMWTRPIAGPGS